MSSPQRPQAGPGRSSGRLRGEPAGGRWIDVITKRVSVVLSWGTMPWAVGAVLLVGGGADGIVWWRWLAFVVWLMAGGAMWSWLPRRRRGWTPWLMFLSALVVFFSVRPSSSRDWTEDQSRVPWVQIDGDRIHVHDIRDFRYQGTGEWEPSWYDAWWRTSAMW